MKQSFTLLICLMSLFSYAQNVGIGTKNPQNKLHVAGGLRIDSLAAKKDSGLILHNKSGDIYSISLTGKKSDVLRGDGTFAAAATLAAPTDAWLLGGNAGTDSVTDFLGTTDNQPLRFRVNNRWFGSLGPNVSLGLNSYGSRTQDPNDPGTTVGDNIAIGNWALARNTLGNQNVAIGSESQRELQGNMNTAVGYNAIRGFTDPSYVPNGSGNTGIGANALRRGAFSYNNTAVGSDALASNAFSSLNTAVGHKSLFTLGSQPIALNTEKNVAVGAFSLYTSEEGSHNVAVGFEAMYGSVVPTFSTAVGYRALYSDNGYSNTAVGAESLEENTTGFQNSGMGQFTLRANTIGHDNSAAGYRALSSNTTGNYNTAGGSSALINNTEGSYNSALGYVALSANAAGKHNTGIGAYALNKNTGELNSALGSNALANNTTGISNTAVGYLTLSNNLAGNANTATGTRALGANTNGVNNTAVGYGALLTNIGGSLNTALGMSADVTSASLSNATAIGYGAKVNASNKVRIGNASVTVIEGQVPFTTPSDGRFKYNVKEDVGGLDFILKLRPVTYQFDVKKFDNIENVSFASTKNKAYEKAALIRRTGFIAQEVEKAAEETNYNFSGVIKPESQKEHYSLSYESFVVPLVKAVQEQQEMITRLKNDNRELKEIVKKQNENNGRQEAMIKTLSDKLQQQQKLIDQLLENAKNK